MIGVVRVSEGSVGSAHSVRHVLDVAAGVYVNRVDIGCKQVTPIWVRRAEVSMYPTGRIRRER